MVGLNLKEGNCGLLLCGFSVRYTYYHGLSLQFICISWILRGVTATLAMFLGMALNRMGFKELLPALGHSVDLNLLCDM